MVFHAGTGTICQGGTAFSGPFTITGGTGRFDGASGGGTFSGILDTITVIGTIRY